QRVDDVLCRRLLRRGRGPDAQRQGKNGHREGQAKSGTVAPCCHCCSPKLTRWPNAMVKEYTQAHQRPVTAITKKSPRTNRIQWEGPGGLTTPSHLLKPLNPQ